jgi:amino acid transporter
MFSSGFFLLPGLAAAQTGSSVAWAYGAAALLILPAMFSVAELATAMPRAGGAYFFIDRALGPAAGTVGGLGTWIALVLKSGFALIGMGAYLALLFDLPIKAVAVGLTLIFAVVNLVGAKESSSLQRVLVFVLIGGLLVWLASALVYVLVSGPTPTADLAGTELLAGWGGFFATVGFVFVSYAGLTKVASVAEEVRRPGRNIPLGMGLSLAVVTLVYVAGVWVMNAVLPAGDLHASLTPVADGGSVVLAWMPPVVGTVLVVAAASAAFASTGNAGILASSRYPLAMARDGLLPEVFARLSRFGTPTLGVTVTVAAMVLFIVAFPVATVAKLAGAFQLLLFGILCLAVIVMRASGIDYYRPSFRSPLFPWIQLAGVCISAWLIWQMGTLAVLFTAGLIAVGLAWYAAYARPRVDRQGALFHVFERLGKRVHRGLDSELLAILAERDAHELAEVDLLCARAQHIDASDLRAWGLIHRVSRGMAKRHGIDGLELANTIVDELRAGLTLSIGDLILAHRQSPEVSTPRLAVGHLRRPLHGENDELLRGAGVIDDVRALVVLVSPTEAPDHHYRLLAELIRRAEQDPTLLDLPGDPGEPSDDRQDASRSAAREPIRSRSSSHGA